MLYAELTPTQRAHVASMFYDAHFGTSPDDYRYETDQRGQITGRVPLVMGERKITRPRDVKTHVAVIYVMPTPELARRREMALDALAGLVIKQLQQEAVKNVHAHR